MKIVFTGSQGTGKTTLVNILKSEYPNYKIATNSTRDMHARGVKINKEGDAESQRILMDWHLRNLENDDFIADRCILDILCYTRYLASIGRIPVDFLDEQENTVAFDVDLYDKVFYIEPEFKVYADGIRSDDDKYQDDVAENFRYYIKMFEIPVIKLTGTVEERIEQIHRELAKA